MFKRKRRDSDSGIGGALLFRRLFAGLGDLPTSRRVEVEAYTSELLAAVGVSVSKMPAAKTPLMSAMVAYLAQRGDTPACAVLAAVADLSDDWRTRQLAQDKLDELAESAPEWSRDPVAFDECWTAGDAYGDRRDTVLTVKAGAQRYALAARVDGDGAAAGPALREIEVVEPEAAVAALKQTHGDESSVVERASPTKAVEPLLAAAANTPPPGEVDESSSLFRLRLLLEARMRLAPGAKRPSERRAVSPELVEDTATTFLSSPEAMFLPGGDATVAAAKTIAAHHLRGGLRVSPKRTETFLDAHDCAAPTPEVLEAFNQWAAIQAGLPQPAVTALLTRTRELTGREADADLD
ncbi:MAG: hypothetical protein ACRDXX_03435 [Stackebrandtia sp.]